MCHLAPTGASVARGGKSWKGGHGMANYKATTHPEGMVFEFLTGEDAADGAPQTREVAVTLYPWTQAQDTDVVYVPEDPDDEEQFYTKARICALTQAYAQAHNLPYSEAHARAVYHLCDWQHPETLLDEDERDTCIWDEYAWDAAARRTAVTPALPAPSKTFTEAEVQAALERAKLEAGLLWHITGNHYPPPPNPQAWVQPCLHAIAACQEGDVDRLIDLPSGVYDTHTNAGSQSPAWRIVEHWHLEDYLEAHDQDDQDEADAPPAPVPASRAATRTLDESDLDPRFAPYHQSGERVEVEWAEGFEDYTGYGAKTEGRKARFYVGKSMGWKPIYLRLHARNSLGGSALGARDQIVSIRGLGIYRDRQSGTRYRGVKQ